MNAFNCANCRNLIQVEPGLVGELVECPCCAHVQIVPDPLLLPGMAYAGYAIRRATASGVLWNSYLAAGPGETFAGRPVLLRIPSTFLLRRVADFKAFAGSLCNAGTCNVAAFPALLDRRLVGEGLYLAYEAVPGAKSLAALAAGAPLRPADALVLARRIAAALADGWGKCQVAHLNLTPEKILVHISRLDVRITDFGTAAAVAKEDRLLRDGLNIWDPRYAAPEFLAEGLADGPRGDIHALGWIMAFMLTGRHPEIAGDDAAASPRAPALPPVAAEQAGIPAEVVALVKAMTEADPARRPASWDDVLRVLDAALGREVQQKLAVENRRQVNLWGAYRPEPVRTVAPSGQRAGTAPRKFHTAKPEEKSLVKAAHGRVFAVDAIRPVNRRWRRSRDAGPSGERVLMMAAAVIAFAFLAVLAVGRMAANSRSPVPVMPPPDDAVADAATAARAPAEPSRLPAVPGAAPDPVATEGTPTGSPPSQRQAELLAQYAQIDADLVANPDDFDGAIQRYEAIKRPFVLADNQRLVGEINERIFAIERRKQRRIEAVMGEVVDAVKPFLERRENDQAINYLRTYDGPFAFDTKRQRLEVERKIIDGISVAELERGKAIISVDAALEAHAQRIMAGDLAGFVRELEIQAGDAPVATRPLIESLLAQARFLGENRSRLQANPAAAQAVLRQLDALGLADSSMAQALVAAAVGNYEEAYASFDRMPFGLGYHFFRPCLEQEAEAVFAQILKDSAIADRRDSPEALAALLARRRIGDAAARKLLAELKEYERNYADTEFLAANRRILEILVKFSQDMHEDRGVAMGREIVISPGDEGSLGVQLARILEEADNWTTIRLRPGVYRLESADEARRREQDPGRLRLEQDTIGRYAFRLSLTGMKLIGEPGVIFENDLVITAQSVEIADIRIRRGKFNIMPHNIGILPDSGNIVVRNCVFEDEETRLIRAVGISLENCFMKGLFVERCNDVRIEHCTIVAQARGLSQSAALWIDGGQVDVRNSILYGETYYALMFSDKGSGIRKVSEIKTNRTINIAQSVVFGEQGLCAFQFEDRPIDEQDVIVSPSRVSRYFRSRGNIFYPPQFTDPRNGDWRLVKGSPGYKGGAPKYKGGPIHYSRSQDARDCGVVWPGTLNVER